MSTILLTLTLIQQNNGKESSIGGAARVRFASCLTGFKFPVHESLYPSLAGVPIRHPGKYILSSVDRSH